MNVKGQLSINTDNNTATGYNAAGWTVDPNKSGAEYMIENNIVYKNVGGGWNLDEYAKFSNHGIPTKRYYSRVYDTTKYTLVITAGTTIRIGYIKNDSLTDRLPAQNTPFASTTLLP